MVFDKPHAQKFVIASQDFLHTVMPPLAEALKTRTVIDAGCGVGYYTQCLNTLGYSVVGFDGREANVDEARRRYPHLDFHVGDIEDPTIEKLGQYDLVLCFGLLYHLENPFRAIRNMRLLARGMVLISTMCTPERYPLLHLLDEGNCGEDQALRYVALYPSEVCVIKMLYRADFPFVYRFARLPDHDDFRSTVFRRRQRSIILASTLPLDFPWLQVATDSHDRPNPWETPLAKLLSRISWSHRLLRKPWPDKVESARRFLDGRSRSQW